MSKLLTLISSDSVKIQIDSKSAERSALLKGLIQDYSEDSEIAMHDVKGDVLKLLSIYLTGALMNPKKSLDLFQATI